MPQCFILETWLSCCFVHIQPTEWWWFPKLYWDDFLIYVSSPELCLELQICNSSTNLTYLLWCSTAKITMSKWNFPVLHDLLRECHHHASNLPRLSLLPSIKLQVFIDSMQSRTRLTELNWTPKYLPNPLSISSLTSTIASIEAFPHLGSSSSSHPLLWS